MLNNIDLSIIIPCFNERHRILETLEASFTYLDSQPISYEILIMDDASTDGFAELVREKYQRDNLYIHQFKKNMGKGYSIGVGVEKALGKYIMFMDADLAVPIEEVSTLLKNLKGGYDVVAGIRLFDNENTSRFRRIIGFSLLLYANIILSLPPVPDTQCGFKGFRCQAARDIFKLARTKRGMFDIEILFLSKKLGLRIKSQPVHWIEKKGSTINLLRCILFDPFDILKISLRDLFSGYGYNTSR
ncbi:glycosyltransferase [bacterium]|nr:glycosyltransferase [bacterium]